ncbi:hypothetical protein SASPL_147016 [Salvia splendens]|uniref:Uncharacterized protein n=1 Tax=Salvia splendens TaxID=180675 RepID=A0A8X8WCX9_SALSN|nr:hypothetical protein SASPL_147016 [Salvia splendens]
MHRNRPRCESTAMISTILTLRPGRGLGPFSLGKRQYMCSICVFNRKDWEFMTKTWACTLHFTLDYPLCFRCPHSMHSSVMPVKVIVIILFLYYNIFLFHGAQCTFASSLTAEVPLEFPDGTTPVACRISVYDSSTDSKVGVGSSMMKACVPPLAAGSLYMEEVAVKLGEELWFTVGGQHISFGASPQVPKLDMEFADTAIVWIFCIICQVLYMVAFFLDKLGVTPLVEAVLVRMKALEGDEALSATVVGSSSIIGERVGESEKWTWGVLMSGLNWGGCEIHRKQVDQMVIHSAPDPKPRTTLCGYYFYNYFTRGLDILFDGQTHEIKMFVLHTNYPGHSDFNSYMKCNFVIHSSDYDGSFHQDVNNTSKCVITPSTKWEQVKSFKGITDTSLCRKSWVTADKLPSKHKGPPANFWDLHLYMDTQMLPSSITQRSFTGHEKWLHCNCNSIPVLVPSSGCTSSAGVVCQLTVELAVTFLQEHGAAE